MYMFTWAVVSCVCFGFGLLDADIRGCGACGVIGCVWGSERGALCVRN